MILTDVFKISFTFTDFNYSGILAGLEDSESKPEGPSRSEPYVPQAEVRWEPTQGRQGLTVTAEAS